MRTTTLYVLRDENNQAVLVGGDLLMVANAQQFHAEEFGKNYVLHIEDVRHFDDFAEWAASTGERPVGWEARCEACGFTFNPSGDEKVFVGVDGDVRVEHYGTEEFGECGGFGPIVGSWGSRR